MVGGLWGGSAWSLVNTPVHKVDFFFFTEKILGEKNPGFT